MILSNEQATAVHRAMCAINAIDGMFSIAFKAPPHFYQVSEETFGGFIDVARYDKDGRYTGRETFEDRAEFARRYGVEEKREPTRYRKDSSYMLEDPQGDWIRYCEAKGALGHGSKAKQAHTPAEVISWDIHENVLTDGSSTFDVVGTSDQCKVTFYCRSETAAEALLDMLNSSDDVIGATAEALP